MADISIGGMSGALIDTELKEWYESNTVGEDLTYQDCKLIYTRHPMGAKIVSVPVDLAMSQRREISIPDSPETMVKDAFEREWESLHVDDTIAQTKKVSRTYGVSAVVIGATDYPMDKPLSPELLASQNIYFNVLDPLNTSGSLSLNQDPNAPDFLKCTAIAANGKMYHFSRSCVIQNEAPVYISYTSSTFGFNGRSVFQRAIFSLKSYITVQVAADELAKKVAVIVAKRKGPGSYIDKISGNVMGVFRSWIKSATNGNVISVDSDDTVETLNLTNADTALSTTRDIVIEDIAGGVNMPAKLLREEYKAGLANGTEDFKATMQYIDGLRMSMQPLYKFFDNIVMQRAWSPEFYVRLQAQFPAEYGNKPYQQAFYEFKNSFTAKWPSLMVEPDSEKSKVEKVKLDAMIALFEKISPELDPENKANLVDWVQMNVNSMKTIFSDPLEIDIEALRAYVPPEPPAMPEQGGF